MRVEALYALQSHNLLRVRKWRLTVFSVAQYRSSSCSLGLGRAKMRDQGHPLLQDHDQDQDSTGTLNTNGSIPYNYYHCVAIFYYL